MTDFSKETDGDSSEANHEFSEDGIRRIKHSYNRETIAQKQKEWKDFVRNLEDYPGNFEGKGIVICAGGIPYFTCAWININLLRRNGGKLPIEMWYQEDELNGETISELKKLDVTCKKFSDFTAEKINNGYQLKPIAILHSSFKEVLYLDADNNCLKDPAFLFDHSLYQTNGAVFWPDYWRTERTNPIWEIIENEDNGRPEQESGQLLINKEKCWKELNLCHFFNFDPFYYQILWGDKDTFRFSWLALKSPFHMIKEGVSAIGFREKKFGFGSVAMLQHDYEGDPLFIHSNLLKWDARPIDQCFWKEIRRLSSNQRRIQMKYHPRFKKFFLSIEGEVKVLNNEDPIVRLEKESLEVLRQLRNSGFYSELIRTA